MEIKAIYKFKYKFRRDMAPDNDLRRFRNIYGQEYTTWGWAIDYSSLCHYFFVYEHKLDSWGVSYFNRFVEEIERCSVSEGEICSDFKELNLLKKRTPEDLDATLLYEYKFSHDNSNVYYDVILKIAQIAGWYTSWDCRETHFRGIQIYADCKHIKLIQKICKQNGGIETDNKYCIYRYRNEQKKSSNGGCYIATVCYGSYDCTQVLTFRNFRDEYLNETFAGRFFIKTYYALSPAIAQWLENKHKINSFVRKNFLNRIYECLKNKY